MTTEKITNLLLKNDINTENLKEKVHIMIHLIDDLCHEIVYHKHSEMDYDKMTDIVIDCIRKIIQ